MHPTTRLATLVTVLTGGAATWLSTSARDKSNLPLAAAEVFAPGTISTSLDELNAAFAPQGNEVYYSINTVDNGRGVIVVSHFDGRRWLPPAVASFSGQYSDYDPFVSGDGKRIFFISNRPKGKPKWDQGDYDIYVAERQGNGWSEPRNLGEPINSDRPEWYPSIAMDGTLYFSTARADSRGGFDLYRSRLVDERYAPPENLGDSVNGRRSEIDNFIAPDQSYIVFAVSGREDDMGKGDLYVSYFRNGSWTQAVNLGPKVNSAAREYTPIVSPDGRFLYWTSKRGFADQIPSRPLTMKELRDSLASVRNGGGNIYRIPLGEVLDLP